MNHYALCSSLEAVSQKQLSPDNGNSSHEMFPIESFLILIRSLKYFEVRTNRAFW